MSGKGRDELVDPRFETRSVLIAHRQEASIDKQ
jgi:hypothetical protein